MYNLHNPKVRRFAQLCPKNLEWVIAFIFSTIRVQTSRLPIMMKEYRKRGLNSSWIWGNKIAGLVEKQLREKSRVVFPKQ